MSLIATVYSEAPSIDEWLATIASQSRQPDEIVVVDAGSTDGTRERLEAFAAGRTDVHVIVSEGANVPRGRNIAIEAATSPVIAVTDAGTRADPTWLERLTEPFADPAVGVVAGFFRPAGRSRLEYLMATVITPRIEDVDEATFLPSSRSVAFRKELWRETGGYPEWLRAGEDLLFSMRLRSSGARFRFASDARVSWYPRPTLRGFFLQYRHYARGDGHGGLFPKRHLARFGAYAAGTVLLSQWRRRWPLLLLAAGGSFHFSEGFKRVARERPFEGRAGLTAWAYAMTPLIVVLGDVGKMLGYPLGLYERLRAGSQEELASAKIESHRKHGDSR